MELIDIKYNLWYGVTYVEDEDYFDDEDTDRTSRGTTARGQRNSPVRRGNEPSIYKTNKSSRRNTSSR